MSRYIPMPAYIDRMPVDISFVFEDEKPAGKHGFLKADGEVMRFEDGTLARFWGVNINGGANFPDKEYAPKFARRLAQTGCNLVRLHQLDAQWGTPNLFAFTKGKRITDTRHFDPRSMDALDYLIYCLKQEGIYIYLDLMTYRKFKEGDDVPFHELLCDNAKPWSITNPRLIELQKEFCYNLLHHYNPYTQLCYKDDPVFVMSEINAECDLFVDSNMHKRWDYNDIPYYENEFRHQFRDWLQEQGITYDWEHCDFFTLDEPMLQFKIHATKAYYADMMAYLKNECGVKYPIAGTNWHRISALLKAHEDMDYTDTHMYFYDWRWGSSERTCKHQAITASPTVMTGGKTRIAGKPFFVSEWDMPWPNSFRAEGPIFHAAIAALQNWTGCTIHTYSYTPYLENMKVLGREVSSPIAGVSYREGIFAVWNDPAKFGLFYHSALMFRRGDVSPAQRKVAVQANDMTKYVMDSFRKGLEKHYMATVFDNQLPKGYDMLIQETDAIEPEDPNLYVSDNGQLIRDLAKQIAMVDSGRTKVIYGQISMNRNESSIYRWGKAPIRLPSGGLEIDSYTDFGVVAVSSLTDEPTETSDNILLSAIGRARNSGAQFDGTKMLELGHAPIEAEVIHAHVKLKTELGQRMSVWGINAEGLYAGQLPTTYEDGYLCFEIGDAMNPACYYLITKE